jgi:uncharacterized RDD family membrane protein YckC
VSVHASAIPPEAEALQGRTAGLVSRSLAALSDGAVVATAMLVGYISVAALLFVWNPRTFTFPEPSAWLTLATADTIAIVYLATGWWIAGRSYGCAVMGLRVVGRDGGSVRFLAALLRAIVCVFFPVGLAWCALDRRGRAVHDALVGTRVIHDWRPRRGQL